MDRFEVEYKVLDLMVQIADADSEYLLEHLDNSLFDFMDDFEFSDLLERLENYYDIPLINEEINSHNDSINQLVDCCLRLIKEK